VKVTKRQLKQIIREETAHVLRREVPAPYQPDLSTHGPKDIAKNGAFHDYIIAGVSEMIGDEGLQAVPLEDIINNTKPNGRDDAYYEHVELWEEIVTEAIEYLAVPNGPMAEHRDREGNLVYTVNPDNMTEAWKGDTEIKQTGDYADKTQDELCSMRSKLKAKDSRTAAESTKLKQLNFAIRSKQKGPKFGKVKC
jgi:hypothetical protein